LNYAILEKDLNTTLLRKYGANIKPYVIMETYTDIRTRKNTFVDYKIIDFKNFLDTVLSDYRKNLDQEYEYSVMDCYDGAEVAIPFRELYKKIDKVYDCYYDKDIEDTLDMLLRLLKSTSKYNVQYVTNY
jgi:hypothetical protein